MKPLTYLICPYSSPFANVRKYRFEMANRAAAHLLKQGWNVFSPLSHSVPIAEYLGNENDSAFWVELDMGLLYACQSVHILKLPGWQESMGVKKEIDAAIDIGMGVYWIEPEEIK